MRKKITLIEVIIVIVVIVVVAKGCRFWNKSEEVPEITPVPTEIILSSIEPYMFVTKCGSEGSGDGEFQYPIKVAVDSEESIYVVDLCNDRIQKFDSNGNFITKWGNKGEKDEQFDNPSDIFIDRNDNIYVSDSDNKRIIKFNSNGKFIMKWTLNNFENEKLLLPIRITMDIEENIYVFDFNKIYIFDSNMKFITTWNLENLCPLFKSVTDIAIDVSGYVYVVVTTDDGNEAIHSTIYKYNNYGKIIEQWGEWCEKNGERYVVGDVEVDLQNNILVTDVTNNQIDIYTSKGKLFTSWGSKGSGDGQFNNPTGITVDPQGNVYVADCENNRIQKFAPNPEFKTNN